MKTLLILRHATAAPTIAGQRDFDRQLDERGRGVCPALGRLLQRERLRPDLVLFSPAERARETAALVVEAAGLITSRLRDDARIYDASVETLVEVISQIEAEVGEALLVGHNPGVSGLLWWLTGRSAEMPPAALARVSLDAEDWNLMRAETGRLQWLVRPEELD